MPFDGRSYAAQDLILPYYYHPGAPVCAVPAMVLRGAYFAARMHGRIVGQQTYQLPLDIPSRYYASVPTFTASTWVDVAYMRRYVPEQATHMVVDCASVVFSGAAGEPTVHHRVIVTGSSAATGTDVPVDRGAPLSSSWGWSAAFSLLDPDNPARVGALATVELGSGQTDQVSEIQVQSYAEGWPLLPLCYSVWWMAVD